jgi:hypothetical protein
MLLFQISFPGDEEIKYRLVSLAIDLLQQRTLASARCKELMHSNIIITSKRSLLVLLDGHIATTVLIISKDDCCGVLLVLAGVSIREESR